MVAVSTGFGGGELKYPKNRTGSRGIVKLADRAISTLVIVGGAGAGVSLYIFNLSFWYGKRSLDARRKRMHRHYIAERTNFFSFRLVKFQSKKTQFLYISTPP